MYLEVTSRPVSSALWSRGYLPKDKDRAWHKVWESWGFSCHCRITEIANNFLVV